MSANGRILVQRKETETEFIVSCYYCKKPEPERKLRFKVTLDGRAEIPDSELLRHSECLRNGDLWVSTEFANFHDY